jgi:uncharacterized protein (DUF433 family)
MTLTFQHLWEGPNGDTAIVGSGLRVYTILGEYEMGRSAEDIAEGHDIPIAAVYEALAYAADHPDEMEAIARADDEADRRITARLPEHLRQIAEEVRVSDEQARKDLIRKAREARRSTSVS